MDYLAFDLGASSGKFFLGRYNGNLLCLDPIHSFTTHPIFESNNLIWNIQEIYKHLIIGVTKAINIDRKIHSFGIDSFSNDFGIIDKNGALLSTIMCYRDERTKRCRDAIFRKMSPRNIYANSGNQISLFSAFMQIASMREEKKDELLNDCHKLLFLPDLLISKMTNVINCEYTIATVSQLWDYQNSNWSENLLSAFQIPIDLFPPISMPGTILGSTSKEWNKIIGENGYSVSTVCEHDTASAFLSSPLEGKHIIISSGTWALVGIEVNNPIINDFTFTYNIANEGSIPGHHRLLKNVMGNWLMQELKNEYEAIGQQFSFTSLIELAKLEKPFRWLIDVDDEIFFLPGNMRGKIAQKCQENSPDCPETPGEFARCISESLAMKYRWCIEKLEQLVDFNYPFINVIGGGSKDSLTCQFTANACDKPLIAGPENASALGNIIIQMLAEGDICKVDEGRRIIQKSTTLVEYSPMNTNNWNEEYQKFKQLYCLD